MLRNHFCSTWRGGARLLNECNYKARELIVSSRQHHEEKLRSVIGGRGRRRLSVNRDWWSSFFYFYFWAKISFGYPSDWGMTTTVSHRSTECVVRYRNVGIDSFGGRSERLRVTESFRRKIFVKVISKSSKECQTRVRALYTRFFVGKFFFLDLEERVLGEWRREGF